MRHPACSLLLLAAVASCSGSAGTDTQPARAASLRIISGFGQTGVVGTALAAPIEVATVDASGRMVPGIAVTFSTSTAGASVSPSSAITDADGRARTQWLLGRTARDADLLVVEISGAAGGATTRAFVIASALPGPAATLQVAPAAVTARAGEAIPGPVTVALHDAYGNRVRQAEVAIKPRLTNGSQDTVIALNPFLVDAGGAVRALTTVSGEATFAGLAVAGKAGALTLQFEGTNVTPASAALTVTAGNATTLRWVGTGSVAAVPGNPAPSVSVAVGDAWGNGVGGVDVSFAVDGTTVGHAISDASGVAMLSTWTTPARGTYTFRASAPGIPAPASVPLLVSAGVPATITSAATNPVDGIVGRPVTFTVAVRDGVGNPVPNTTVIWSLGSATGQQVTDAGGSASFMANLPSKAGSHSLVVRSGPTATTSHTIQVVADRFDGIRAVRSEVDVAAGTLVNLEFLTADKYGNGVPSIPVRFLTSLYGPPVEVISDATGLAVLPFAAPSVARHVWVEATAIFSAVMTSVYTSSTRGTVNVDNEPCVEPITSFYSLRTAVYGSNGRGVAGIPVTFTLAPGNGELYEGIVLRGQTLTLTTNSGGGVVAEWKLPGAAGNYSVTVTTPPGYDAQSPLRFTCKLVP